ncbi:MAG: succinylglutamate desuccinylase/aspartoacylase family protein [Rhodospirillales bacterium]|nr:succinylglutamate desuccinylase/aspartoacylase family protein [Rhodospirillales bacterium]
MGNSAEKSKISTSLDFRAVGKQVGHLVVPHSTNTSAWGAIEIPVAVISRGEGPTAFFTGANHGDEYEGPIALSKLIRSLEPEQVHGTVIIMPALNLPAFRATRRLSPIDGMNMNRAFPGKGDGSVTSMIAHFVSTRILPLADVVVDIHAGGKTLDFLPCAVIHELDDDNQMSKTLAAQEAFGAPFGLVLRELDAAGMLDTTVEEMGKVFLSTELGGGGTATPETVAIAEIGVRNILAHFGILDEKPLSREDRGMAPMRLVHSPHEQCFTSARDNGLFEPFRGLGDEVEKGDPLGQIHFIETPERDPLMHHAGRSGVILCKGVPGLVGKGDCLVVVGEDYKDK